MFFCQVITLIEAMKERVYDAGKQDFSILVTFSIMMMLKKQANKVLIQIRQRKRNILVLGASEKKG